MPDLTSLAAVKSWLGGTASLVFTADALLGDLIAATSADFLRAVARPDLLERDYIENRIGDGSVRLVLRHWPVTGITSLKIGAAAIPQQAAGVDGWYFDTGADPERDFVVYLSGALTFQDAAPVAIAYKAGYPLPPADIAQAVTEWVAFRYTRKSSTGQTSARGVESETTHFDSDSVPANTQRVIAAYRRKFAPYGTDNADRSIGAEDLAMQNKPGMRGGRMNQ